jgi:N-acyl homoserine lactone hydrolase
MDCDTFRQMDFDRLNKSLLVHPSIHRLDLGFVNLPEWHPRAEDKVAPIFAYAVEHPDGVILFDCGCADDSELINQLYRPQVCSLAAALNATGLDLGDIKAVVLSHLHFDHCGQMRSVYGRPIFVQRAEIVAAQTANYTITDWAFIPVDDRRIVESDECIAEGLEIVTTPGHTPGHQSLVVRGGNQTTILAGQCCYCAMSFVSSDLEQDNLFDKTWAPAAQDSIEKLRSLSPDRVLLSHDKCEWLAP